MVIAMSSNIYVINAYSGFRYCVYGGRINITVSVLFVALFSSPTFYCAPTVTRFSLTHTHSLHTALSCVHHGNLSYSRIYIVVYGFYLPGVQPTEWNVGDSVPLFMNSLTSVVTHLPMGYESIKVGTISRAFQIVFISYIVYLA